MKGVTLKPRKLKFNLGDTVTWYSAPGVRRHGEVIRYVPAGQRPPLGGIDIDWPAGVLAQVCPSRNHLSYLVREFDDATSHRLPRVWWPVAGRLRVTHRMAPIIDKPAVGRPKAAQPVAPKRSTAYQPRAGDVVQWDAQLPGGGTRILLGIVLRSAAACTSVHRCDTGTTHVIPNDWLLLEPTVKIPHDQPLDRHTTAFWIEDDRLHRGYVEEVVERGGRSAACASARKPFGPSTVDYGNRTSYLIRDHADQKLVWIPDEELGRVPDSLKVRMPYDTADDVGRQDVKVMLARPARPDHRDDLASLFQIASAGPRTLQEREAAAALYLRLYNALWALENPREALKQAAQPGYKLPGPQPK
jgi:hypothetical protein